MFKKYPLALTRTPHFALLLSSLVGGTQLLAHDGHTQPSSQKPIDSGKSKSGVAPVTLSAMPPHGGLVSRSAMHFFEVVFFPHETRVYVFGPSQRPVTAKGVQGEVVMQVRGNPQLFRYPASYVAPPAGATEQDFVRVQVDLTRIRDGDLQATFTLGNLPYRQEPSAQFSQVLVAAKVAPPVMLAQLTEADRQSVAQQRLCPVTQDPFDHGPPIKLFVDNRPLYVCCDDCVEAVKKNPQLYLGRAWAGQQQAAQPAPQPQQPAPQQQPPVRPMISAAPASAADQSAIRAQRVCPVMNQPLGGHGTPLKVSINGDSLFVCCQGCVRKVEANPQEYLAWVANVRQGR